MSETVNPYQSPETEAVQVKPLIVQGNLTELMLIYLKGASPWLKFIGILGFVFSGLTFMWGLSLMALIPRTWQAWGFSPGFESFSDLTAAMGLAFGGSMGLFSCIGGIIMFIPSIFIYKYGEKINSFLKTGSIEDLEIAFKNNKSLWKYLGIICIIMLAFIPVAIISGIVVAIALALI